MKPTMLFGLFLGACGVAGAATPQFDVPAEGARTFYAAQSLHSGDVLQIRARHLLGDETLVFARCSDDDLCRSAQIVALWRHGFHDGSGISNTVIRNNIAVRADGRYFFWLVKNSDCFVDHWSCRNGAWPGVLTYGKPEALPIAQAAQDGAFYKVKYDSGSLIYVRKLGAEAAHG